MRILVTGAAGFIASHLCQKLAAIGHDVVALDSFNNHYDPQLKRLNAEELRTDSNVEVGELDLVDAPLDAVMANVDVVYHLAAQPGISATTPFESYLQNNIVATHKLMLAVMNRPEAERPLVVNIATSSIYGADATGPEDSPARPTSHYGVTKLAAEQLILALHRDRGLHACSLRLFSVYGPRERPEKLYPLLLRALLLDDELPLFEGAEKHLRAFTFVSDIIDGLVAVLEHRDACNGEIFNIGADVQLSTGEVIAKAEEIVGRSVRVKRLPRRPGDQARTFANIDKARQLLGYNPSVSITEGLRQHLEWMRRRLQAEGKL